jgi:hypothetical protein
MKEQRITKLPNYTLRVPILAEVEKVKDNYGGITFYANAKRTTGIEISGQGSTPSDALKDLGMIIDTEYRFMSSQPKPARLTKYAKELVNKIGHHILSEREAA